MLRLRPDLIGTGKIYSMDIVIVYCHDFPIVFDNQGDSARDGGKLDVTGFSIGRWLCHLSHSLVSLNGDHGDGRQG
jgi:hypothetical protein